MTSDRGLTKAPFASSLAGMRSIVLLGVLVSVSGCRCGKYTDGSCTGSWGGVSLQGASLDRTSRMALVYGATCANPTVNLYALSWGNGALATQFTFVSGGPTILGGTTTTLPPKSFTSFSVVPTPPDPQGTLTLAIRGLEGDRTGELVLRSPTEEMRCSFAVSYETEGVRPSCGGGGDGD